MKLKKIASLMLAGIMAVSMLAACGSTEPTKEPTDPTDPVANDFTSTVLGKTSEYTQNVLSVNDDENLDKAVAYVCDNSVINSYQNAMSTEIENNGTYKELYANASKFLPTSDYTWSKMSTWEFDGANKDETYVGMYVVGGKMTDEWIANELASKIDDWAKEMNKEGFEYSIKVVKGTCQNTEDVKEYETSTVVGVLVEVDDTTNNH